jgi:hypothetical protein
VQFRPPVHIEPVDHSALLTEITGISNLEQAEYSLALSRISSIPVLFFVSAREFLTFRLYQSVCNFMESLEVARLLGEIFHQVLFNPWIWCGSKGFDRVYRNWPTMLEAESRTEPSERRSGDTIEEITRLKANSK